MNSKALSNLILLFILIFLAIIGFAYLKPFLFNVASDHHAEASSEHSEDFKRGPHRGRLLEKEAFQVEVTIFEPEGTAPKFRIYFYDNDLPVDPAHVKFEMELKRINRTEKIPFKQVGDFLESTVEASEPHSFQVNIKAEYRNKVYAWEYESYEGRLELTQEALEANRIKIEEAGPVNLEIKLDVMGKIVPNEERTVYITPRFPGMVKAVNKKLGDFVQKGEVLAIIESNESLQNYEVRAEMNGLIIKKNINLGTYLSGQENIYVISDLSSVWVDFNIYHQDLPQVQVGEQVLIKSLDERFSQQSYISYISPLGHESTQSVIARAVLDNPEKTWKPGLFVSGQISVDNLPVPVAVKDKALQTFRDWDVVFISVGNTFEVVPVQIGKRNREWVEITSGIKPGDRYVSDNSFILKADLEKSGATHEH